MNGVHRAATGLLLLFSALTSTQVLAEKQDCAEVFELLKSQKRDDFIALPHTGSEMNSMFDTHQVCYRGKDLSQWAAGAHMDLTSGINGIFKDGTAAIVTAHQRSNGELDYSEGNYNSSLILLRVDEKSKRLTRTELMTQQPNDDPAKAIADFRITGYDDFNKTVYFQAPAWTTSDAVYSFRVSPALQGKRPSLKYFGPGRVDMVINDLGFEGLSNNVGKVLIWRDEYLPNQGRIEVLYLFDNDGKRICKVKSSDPSYRFNLTCDER